MYQLCENIKLFHRQTYKMVLINKINPKFTICFTAIKTLGLSGRLHATKKPDI